jgi:hypothetical protein
MSSCGDSLVCKSVESDRVECKGTLHAAKCDADAMKIKIGSAPASAEAAGKAGDVVLAAGHIYVCVADNEWKRVAIATWGAEV